MRTIRVTGVLDGMTMRVRALHDVDGERKATADDWLAVKSIMGSAMAYEDPRDPNRAFAYNLPVGL